MKKKIRTQINLLAQEILESENFETRAVKSMVGKLYEKLAVLEYLENQLKGETSGMPEESLDSKSFREENWFKDPEPLPEPIHKEELAEPLVEKIKDLVAQMPEESEKIDEVVSSILEADPEPPATPKRISSELEDFASRYQKMPEFERKTGGTKDASEKPESTEKAPENKNDLKSKSLNEQFNRGLNIGLNDRLAFIKHLFEGQTEDFTRVISQINTLQNFEEAEEFIETRVKPEYKSWEEKETYFQRFMDLVEKRFN